MGVSGHGVVNIFSFPSPTTNPIPIKLNKSDIEFPRNSLNKYIYHINLAMEPSFHVNGLAIKMYTVTQSMNIYNNILI